MWGPCACPRPGRFVDVKTSQSNRVATKDRHKAPALPHIRPLSLQDGAKVSRDDPIRSAKFIRHPFLIWYNIGPTIRRYDNQPADHLANFSYVSICIKPVLCVDALICSSVPFN